MGGDAGERALRVAVGVPDGLVAGEETLAAAPVSGVVAAFLVLFRTILIVCFVEICFLIIIFQNRFCQEPLDTINAPE